MASSWWPALVPRGFFQPGAPVNPNLAIVGDSLVAFGTSSWYWINGFLGGKLKPIALCGVSGETTQDVLNRIHDTYNPIGASPGGLGGLSLGLCGLRIGTNDLRAGTPIGTLGPVYDSLIAAILTHAEFLVVQAVPPFKSSGVTFLATAYNNYLAAACAANPSRLHFLDDCVDLQTAGSLNEEYFILEAGPQYIHLSSAGVLKMGQRGAMDSTLASMLASYPSPVITDAADVYPATNQWVTNAVNAGTAGTKSGGVTGTVPTGWDITGAGGVAAVASIVAADGGDPNQTPWMRVTPSTGSSSGGAGFTISTVLNGRTVTTNDPYAVDKIVEFRFNSLDTTKVGDLICFAQHGSTGNYMSKQTPFLCLGYDDAVLSGSAVLRSEVPRDNAAAQSGTTLFIQCGTTAFTGGGVGSFDIRCATVKG